MPITFKSPLSSAVANATFLDKTVDDIKKGKLHLYKTTIGESGEITDVQQFINDIAEVVGIVGETDPNKNTYSSEEIISNGDDRKVAIGKLDAQVKLNLDKNDAQDLIITDHETRIGTNETNISTNQTEIQAIEDSVGAANGIAPLGGDVKIDISYLPDAVLGNLRYQSAWDANTNTPTITSSTGTQGHYYVCNVAGTTNIDGISDWENGDWIVFNGTVWEQIDNSDKVSSVNGQTGVVTITKTDVNLGNVTDDAQLKRAAGDLNTFTEKASPVIDDIVIIEDSEDSFNKKKVKLENMLGSGGGGYNYIENNDAEKDTTGWVLYANTTASIRPDDFGGTPTGVTFTRDLTENLIGTASFKFSKDAVDRQGQGVYTEFSNEKGHSSSTQLLSIISDLSDSNLNDGDLAVYLVASSDSFVADFQVIESANPDVKAGLGEILKRFQFLSGELDYRLCLHIKSTNVLAYDVWFDDVSLAPKSAITGAVQKDFESYIPTFTGFGIVSVVDFKYKQVGDSLLIQGSFTSGTPTATEAQVSLPLGVKIKLGSEVHSIGAYFRSSGAVSETGGSVLATNGDQFINFSDRAIFSDFASDPLLPVNGNRTSSGAGQKISFTTSLIPIQGWSSNAISSEDYGSRDVEILKRGNGGESFTNNVTNIPFGDISTYTLEESGSVYLKGNVRMSAAITSQGIDLYVDKNDGSGFVRLDRLGLNRELSTVAFSGMYTGNKGDVLAIRSSASGTLLNSSHEHYLRIKKIASSQSIWETETVAARATSNSGQTLPTTDASNFYEYEDIDYDSHGIIDNSGGETVVTFKHSGIYAVKASVNTLIGTYAAGNLLKSSIYLNGSVVDTGRLRFVSSYNSSYSNFVCTSIRVSKGDVMRIDHIKTGSAISSSTTSSQNVLAITRIGD